jgi:hypothetical protein
LHPPCQSRPEIRLNPQVIDKSILVEPMES